MTGNTKTFRLARIDKLRLEELTNRGLYMNASDAIRDAIRQLCDRNGIHATEGSPCPQPLH